MNTTLRRRSLTWATLAAAVASALWIAAADGGFTAATLHGGELAPRASTRMAQGHPAALHAAAPQRMAHASVTPEPGIAIACASH